MGATPAGGGLLAGRYELGPLVGLGGTARVFRAWDHAGGGSVAVKIFPPGTATSTRAGSREHDVLIGVRHVGLIEVRDSGTADDGCPFVVMDFIEGESLAARLRRGALPPGAVIEIGTVLAAALAHVHARGVVHRDVKPGNVLLDGAGRPWLADFGIARIVDATRVTATGVVVGTAAYMAPEQVRGEAVGPAADVYALGLVLLEAVTGRREYEGGALESAMARLNRTPHVPSEVPNPLAAAVRRMTLAEPADRPTAAQVATALDEAADSGGLAQGLARRAVDRRLVPVGALAVLATAALGGALLLGGGDAGNPTDDGARPGVGPAPVAPALAGSAPVAPAAGSVAPPVAAAREAPDPAVAVAPVPAGQVGPPAPDPAPADARGYASDPPAPVVAARTDAEQSGADQTDDHGRGGQNDGNGNGNGGKAKGKGNGGKGKG